MALVSCLVVCFAVCCLLFVVRCLLSARCRQLFAVSCLLSVVCCLLSVVCCLLFADCCLLSVVRCLLSAVCCLLFAVCCLLSVVCCLLFVVCCLLFAVCCLLLTFVICSLFVRCLFTLCTLSFRSLFVLCSLSVCCHQLFASCMPAAVGRKIKYRFHAWQAPEVFSKRQPSMPLRKFFLIAFMWHLCDVRPHQYSCLRPSGRCRRKCRLPVTFLSGVQGHLLTFGR